MSYDDWKTTEPDYYTRGVRCETPGCDQAVSLPEWDRFCADCRQQQQDRAEAHERWLASRERKRA